MPILRKIERLFTPGLVDKLDPKMRSKINRIRNSIVGRKLTIDDLPLDLTRHFDDLQGRRGVVVFINPRPGMLLSDGRNLMRFAATIRDIRLEDGRVFHAAGESLIYSDLISIIKDEAPLLTVVALIAVIVFVIAMLRRMSVSIVIVVGLLWAILAMMGIAVLNGIKINFFNFIVLPLTFGIGVDYALNMAVRLKQEEGSVAGAIRHTGGAVALCSTTTIVGYFVLTRASNQALATFGSAAVIGEITCIIAALVLVPAVIVLLRKHGRGKSDD